MSVIHRRCRYSIYGIGAWLCLVALTPSTPLFGEQNGTTSCELNVEAKRVSIPSLDVCLFPRLSQRQPGDAASTILRVTSDDTLARWETLPSYIDPRDILKASWAEFVATYARSNVRSRIPGNFFPDLKQAAYCQDAKWPYPSKSQGLGFSQSIELPEADPIRVWLRCIAVHCRCDIAEGRTGDAIQKITVGLGVAKQYEAEPFVVTKYVCLVEVNVFLDRIEELIQQSGCPNMYWAVASLPKPFADVAEASDWVRSGLVADLHTCLESTSNGAKARRASHEELGALIESSGSKQFGNIGYQSIKIFSGDRVDHVSKNKLASMRNELLEILPEARDRVGNMAKDELVVMWRRAMLLSEWDRMCQVAMMPPYVAIARIQSEVEIRDRQPGHGKQPDCTGELPSIYSLCMENWALCRRLDALRTVEALRDYAARNDEQLPESLSAVKQMCIPRDVMTGKPFDYSVKNGVAYLSGPVIALTGGGKSVVRYTIRVRRSRKKSVEDGRDGQVNGPHRGARSGPSK